MANREQHTALVSDTAQVRTEPYPIPWLAPAIPTELESTTKALKLALAEMDRMQDEIDNLNGRLARAGEMIRIKDVLINKQIARITHLEARNG